MSSGITLLENNNFHISKENIKKMECDPAVINVLGSRNWKEKGISYLFSWIGYSMTWDDEAILGLSPLGDDCASNYFHDFIKVITPYVSEGSYLGYEQEGESYRAWYTNGKLEYISPRTSWENEDNTKFSVGILWGSDGTSFSVSEFETEKEQAAYLQGVDDMSGWFDYRNVDDDDLCDEEQIRLQKENPKDYLTYLSFKEGITKSSLPSINCGSDITLLSVPELLERFEENEHGEIVLDSVDIDKEVYGNLIDHNPDTVFTVCWMDDDGDFKVSGFWMTLGRECIKEVCS